MNRLLALAAAGWAAFALGACARSTEHAPKLSPDTYVYLTISDIDSLDPAWSYDTASHNILLNLYEPLLAFKPGSTSELIPRLASAVPSRSNGLISGDGKVYTLPIRKGVKFHDGSLMTPEDVRYSLMRFMLFDRDAGPSSIVLEPVVGYAATREKGKILEKAYDDADKAVRVKGDAVVLTLAKPFSPILSILTLWAPILSRDWCAKHGQWDGSKASWERYNNPLKEASYLHDHANGTGPFELERWDVKTKEIVLKRFDAYWGGPAKLARAVIKGVDEFATRRLMLQAGDADAIYADRLQQPLLQGMPGVRIIDGISIVEMNPSVFFTFDIDTVANPNIGSGKLDGEGIPADFFADPEVRKGFACSFDYEGYIRDIDRGQGSRAAGFIPKGLLGYGAALPKYDFDLKKAAEHFKKARGGEVWEKGFRLTIAYNAGNMPRETVSNMLKRAVESLNPKFRIDTRPIQWSTYLDLMNHSKLPVFMLGWSADYPDPHNFAFTYMHSKGNFPFIQRYRNPAADALVERAMTELAPKKRADLYLQLQRLYFEEAPGFSIHNALRFRTERDRVKGFVADPVWPDAPYSCPLYYLEKAAG